MLYTVGPVLMLYTVGPVTGWFLYSKQSVFSLRRELNLFVCFTLIFVVKGEIVCRALKHVCVFMSLLGTAT